MSGARSAGICLLLVLVTSLVYAQTLRHDFVSYDDPGYITENDSIRLGLSPAGFAWAWTQPWMGNYHPITTLTYLADYQLHGLQAGGYHATNLALHVLATLVLFGFLQSASARPWPSAGVAALFALHPLHVESVAWIAERKDVLSAGFGFGSLWAWVAWTRGGRTPAFYALAVALLALGLLSKPMLVSFPVLMLLLDHWPLGRLPRPTGARQGWARLRPLLVEKLPFFALAAASAVVTWLIQDDGGAVNRGAISLENTANAIVSYARYPAMLLWPSELSVLYPHPSKPQIGGVALRGWEVAQAVVLLALASLLALRSRRGWAPVGWLWYAISLLPVAGFIEIGSHALADRYSYIPSVGLFLIAGFGLADAASALSARWRAAVPVAAGLAVAVLAACGVAAHAAAAVWRDSQSLYEQGLRVTPNNTLLRYNLANDLRRRGELEPAIAHYRQALAIRPSYVDARLNLGDVLSQQGRHEEALAEFLAALEIEPGHASAHNNAANSLSALGRDAEAEQHYRAAIAAATGSRLPHFNYGNFLQKRDRLAEAEVEYRAALALEPDDPSAITNLGNTLLKRGRRKDAIALYRRALELAPEHPLARRNLELALQGDGG